MLQVSFLLPGRISAKPFHLLDVCMSSPAKWRKAGSPLPNLSSPVTDLLYNRWAVFIQVAISFEMLSIGYNNLFGEKVGGTKDPSRSQRHQARTNKQRRRDLSIEQQFVALLALALSGDTWLCESLLFCCGLPLVSTAALVSTM